MRTVENSKIYPWLLLTPALVLFAIWNLGSFVLDGGNEFL